MNLDKLLKKLLAAGRLNPPSDQVPYAFEKRIMARLQGVAFLDPWTLWGRALWRGALLCTGIMVLSGVWWIWPVQSNNASADFVQEFQTAVFAQASQVDYSE